MSKKVINHESSQFVSFQLSGIMYAIHIMDVNEIIAIEKITFIPNTIFCILGVINLRGNIIPIIDLNKRFNIISNDNSKSIIILKLPEIIIGIVIDDMPQVISISKKSIIFPPSIMSIIEANYIEGIFEVDNKLFIILNINNLLSKNEVDIIKNNPNLLSSTCPSRN